MNLSNLFKNTNDILEFSEGATIFSTGDPGDSMYVVIEGEVELFVGNLLVDTVMPGSIFGEMALIDSGPRSATAIAKTNCKLARVDQRLFIYMVQQTPFFALEVMKILSDRLRAMNSSES
jgi:CRP/FNR family transcriptional regulator, cyclic AMP receptor protein